MPVPAGPIEELERRKLAAEIARIEAEARKTERESRGFGAGVGTIVSVATVLTSIVIGGSQIWLANLKDRNDQRLREVELGLRAADFVLQKADLFLAVSADGQRAFVGLIVDTFPAEDAIRVLRRFGATVTQAESAGAVCSGLTRLGATADAVALGCTGEPPLLSPGIQTLATSPAAPTPVRVPVPAPTDSPPVCAGRPRPTESILRAFVHVALAEDRATVQRLLAGGLGQSFPVGGVELVSVRNPYGLQPQVRYYFPDQCERAAELAARLTPLLREATGRADAAFEPRFIGDSFVNLPRGRIEIWFPSLTALPQ